MLTELQKDILEFAKKEYFKVTLKDYLASHGVPEIEAVSALKDLKARRIVSMPPNLLSGTIGVTNYGWKVMSWKKS